MSATIVKGPSDIELTASDRCDYCGAQAFVVASFLAGPLLLCGHDYAEWQIKIDATAFEVLDYRERINAKPSQSTP
jgi:hypothetical protein